MKSYTREKIAILRQVNPCVYTITDDDIVDMLLYEEMERQRVVAPIHFYDVEEHDDYETLGFCECVYDKGYDAVINDGKLIAFKKAV